ncbi:MAG TPA: hypothetical protein VFQ67_09910 [Allosphingosinicella sp.]|jgi:hypothetical protein|nr:hypothetical protein [Allosphingosinicella sp.]
MTQTALGSELFIHLDTAGLAALLKAVEAAMVAGEGHLSLRGAGGMVARSGGSSRFESLTVVFADSAGPPDDAWRTRNPDPAPEPRSPVLELQD